MYRILISFLFIFYSLPFFSQDLSWTKIDSLLHQPEKKTFNGHILITRNGLPSYFLSKGFSDFGNKTELSVDDRFVIGSISKQITAILVLQEYQKGNIRLHESIAHYLPDLLQPWKEEVTVHHLLTHTHGIKEKNKPLAFSPGSGYEYSMIGYELLADILEAVTGTSFQGLSAGLFEKYGMNYTCYPEDGTCEPTVTWYEENKEGCLLPTIEKVSSVPAGGFISTVKDLAIWNHLLFEKGLLNDSTLQLMITPQPGAVRQHPVFGRTEYGYGVTVSEEEGILWVGQTGYAPGFVSMNYYFPQTKTGVIVLTNVATDTNNLKKTFYYLTEILNIVKQEVKSLK